VKPLHAAALADAAVLHDRLTKPRGSLGRLEAIGIQLCGIAGRCPPPLPVPAAVAVFAGDHGVVAEGVTPWPQEVTAQMVANFAAGGAAINVLARQVGATVTVVDVGVASDLPAGAGVVSARVRPGTANIAVEPAMAVDECRAAMATGGQVAGSLVAGGARALVTGEMGIGNTTAAAALIAALTGLPAAAVTGRGTGVDDAGLARKVAVVERSLARHEASGPSGAWSAADLPLTSPFASSRRRQLGGRPPEEGFPIMPLDVLASLGGLEIAALAGFIVAGTESGVPVIVDGVIAGAALLAAERLVPGVAARCLAGHRSTEPGATAVLDVLGMEPVLDLGIRLGEGSGACLALPVVEAAARVLREMATFDSAGVTDKAGS